MAASVEVERVQQHSAWRVLAPSRDRVGESPVWDAQAQALWWVDIEGRQLRRWLAQDNTVHSWATPERTGCIALSTRGTVIAAMESRVVELAAQPGQPQAQVLAVLAGFSHPQPNMRANDGRCDAQGRFWISTMCMDMSLAAPVGAWFVLDEQGLGQPQFSGLVTPNGLAFSGDGRRAYFSDSHPSVQQVWTCDRDSHSGALSARRPWIDMQPLPGRPDGAAVDAQDCYWICGNDAGQIHRFSPAGEWLQSLNVPVPKPAMCCFGGSDLRTLFVTSIQPPVPPQDMGQSGAVLACELSVAGRIEPRFSRFPTAAAPA